MPRNGSGGYSLIQNSWNPAINGMGAQPNDWQALINDVAAAVQASIAADGQTPITGSLNFGGNRLRNVGVPQGQGDGLRFEQLTKGSDVPSAPSIAFPIEGSLFDVTGTTTITGINSSFPGHQVLVRFTDVLTLKNSTNLLLPDGADITTEAGDFAALVCTDGSVWQCWVYPRAQQDTFTKSVPWLSKIVGEPFALRDDLTGVVSPPTDDPRFRYVKLTASDAYNTDVLTGESVSGSAPLITATAVISLAGSPLNGQTVNLVNTERRTFRAGQSGALEDSQNLSHSHSLTDPGHIHTATNSIGPAGTVMDQTIVPFGVTTNTGPVTKMVAISKETTGISIVADGGNEVRVRNQGVTYYMRIK